MCHDGVAHFYILQNYNVRLVLMLHITLWLWYTANGCLSVESREKRYILEAIGVYRVFGRYGLRK